jgi:hypothetical protein
MAPVLAPIDDAVPVLLLDPTGSVLPLFLVVSRDRNLDQTIPPFSRPFPLLADIFHIRHVAFCKEGPVRYAKEEGSRGKDDDGADEDEGEEDEPEEEVPSDFSRGGYGVGRHVGVLGVVTVATARTRGRNERRRGVGERGGTMAGRGVAGGGRGRGLGGRERGGCG